MKWDHLPASKNIEIDCLGHVGKAGDTDVMECRAGVEALRNEFIDQSSESPVNRAIEKFNDRRESETHQLSNGFGLFSVFKRGETAKETLENFRGSKELKDARATDDLDRIIDITLSRILETRPLELPKIEIESRTASLTTEKHPENSKAPLESAPLPPRRPPGL